ncbi:MAG: hypothetical protein IKP36_09165 [Bacteroidaceae bacterium]|nr:hypothetical protein [Bacteroidaceae bacterium]
MAISLDVNDNRRHVHVFWKGKRHQHSLAKIWIEKNEPYAQKWMVLDDQYFTFENMTRVYSLLDLLKVA